MSRIKIEVRCCCQPQKLLGWLPVDPKDVRRGAVIKFIIPPFATFPADETVTVTPLARVALPVEHFHPGGFASYYPALKSEETPIEVLGRIPGFVENTL
jgi:hypothetical protein